MCNTHDHISNSSSWNWDGDFIIQEPIIPNARKVINTNEIYDVDIREFLSSSGNAVIKRALGEITDELSSEHQSLFLSRKPDSFDFRVRVLSEFVSHRIIYQKGSRRFDNWLFPDETLVRRKGDCEDRAFLLASLLIASGVSSYNIRLSFGKIVNTELNKSFDHVWVMYKNEGGIWQLIEPLTDCREENADKVKSSHTPKQQSEPVFSYVPYFLCNNEHLWAVCHPENNKSFQDYILTREFWEGYNPSFGYAIHKGLVNDALNAQQFYNKLTDSMKSELFTLRKLRNLGPVDYLNSFATKVADVDITLSYNPLHHYDNSFIVESFNLMQQNLQDKYTLNGLSKALHAVADLYSHSSYPEFANVIDGNLQLLATPDPSSPNYVSQFIGGTKPSYDKGIFALNNFTTNTNLYKQATKNPAVLYWNDKIISGRYGQSHDSDGLLERTQYWPSALKESEMQGALPHHNEIAVDDLPISSKHKLYSASVYGTKFNLRNNAAKQHIALLFSQW